MRKNGFYNTATGLIRIGIGIVTIPVLIRSLGVEEYGLWTLVSTVISVVNLAEAGLSTTTTIFVSQDLARDDFEGLSQTLTVIGGAMLILATVAAVILWVGAKPIVSSFATLDWSQKAIVSQSLQIGGLVVWTRLLQQVLVGIEQAYQRYDLMNLLNTIQSLLGGCGILGIVWSGGRTIALIEFQAFAGIIILAAHVWLVFSLTRQIRFNLDWNGSKSLTIIRYSMETWFASLGSVLFTQVDKLIVGSMLGSIELGIYGAITNITSQINMLSALPVQPLVPVVSKHFASKTIDDSLKKQVKSALQLNLLVCLGMGTILFSFAPIILNMLSSNGFTENSVILFRVAVIIYALYSVNAVGYYILFAMNKVILCVKIQLISGLLSLSLIYIGANNFGLMGATLGNVGYLGVCFLTVAGMRTVDIDGDLWLGWVRVPILWFVFSLISNKLAESNFLITLLLLIFEFAFLFIWYLKNNSIDPKTINEA